MEFIDVTVFLLSFEFGEWLGGGIVSLLAELLLDSHEKPMPSFREGGAGEGLGPAALGAGGCPGGGPHGIEGRLPDKPRDLEDALCGEAWLSVAFSLEVAAVDSDIMELVSAAPSPSCTSSSEEAEMRCAVSNGDFLEGPSS